MNTKLFTRLLVAAAAVSGVLSHTVAASANPLVADDSIWNVEQLTILGKSQTGFDDSSYQKFVQAERVAIANSGQLKVNSSQLKLKYDYNVSAFFINEGAEMRNQLAFTSTGATNTKGLIFKDISCQGAACLGDWGGSALKFGDGVQLGQIKGGSQLDFFLRADGLNLGTNANIYGTQTGDNADGLQHAVAYAISGKYILLGFEDLYGEFEASGGRNQESDRDLNDVVFAVDIGEENVRSLLQPVPEPSVTLSLLGLGAAGLMLRRRQNSAIK